MTKHRDIALFDDCVRRISDAYISLGHQLGWHFLHTPKQTFCSEAPFWFLALNPGGRGHRHTKISVEDGNAYRIEHWGGTPEPKPLQRQVVGLFDEIANHLAIGRDDLMDRSLCSNICPFRSPSWKELPRKRDTMRFCDDLWRDITRQLSPRVVVTIAPLATRVVLGSFRECGYSIKDRSKVTAGWGNVQCERIRLLQSDRSALIVRFPHFSRYGLVGRESSMPTVRLLAQEIAEAIDSGQ